MGIKLNIFDNKTQLQNIPQKTGVYLIRNREDEIIYVGKAKNLRKRVSSYLHSETLSPFKQAMVNEAGEIEIVVVEKEKEAYLLECSFIKEYRPPYNIVLRDDKSYPYLRLTLSQKFPSLTLARRVKKKGDLYVGPITPVKKLGGILRVLRRTFPIIQRKISFCLAREEPCIYYQMGLCSAPCCGKISEGEYGKIVEELKLLLQGNGRELVKKLKEQMKQCAENLNFEKAARLRDRINAVRLFYKGQEIVEMRNYTADVIGFAYEHDTLCANILSVRDGNITASRSFFLENVDDSFEIREDFIVQYYLKGEFLPKEIVTSKLIKREIIQELLNTKLVVPRRGKKVNLLRKSEKNAQTNLQIYLRKVHIEDVILEKIKEYLSLKKIPYIFDVYDVSHIGGTNVAGASVRYSRGFVKDMYRRFSMEKGVCDLDWMCELAMRHIKNIQKEGRSMPHVILVDGGMQHADVVREVVPRCISVAGIAKEKINDKVRRAKGDVLDRIYTKEGRIDVDDDVLRFFQKLRDEVHRFALSFHRTKRRKMVLTSLLDRVEGVAQARKRLLLRHFGSIEAIAKADCNKVAKVGKISMKQAYRLVERLREIS